MKSLYESILRSVSAGKAFYTKAIADKNFTPELIVSLEKEVAIWKPKDKKELYDVTDLYIESAGPECSLNWIDVSGIKDISNIFYKSNFNGDISKWDVSNVEDMSMMFYNSKFNGDISKWDVSNCKNMSYMFVHSQFNGDISKWDVRAVENVSYMFAYSIFNRDISKWDIRNAKNTGTMFLNCKIDERHKPKME